MYQHTAHLPFPRPALQGTPDGHTLSYPALSVQYALGRAPSSSRVLRRGCRAVLGETQ